MKNWLKRALTALLCALVCMTGLLGLVACDKGGDSSSSSSISGSTDDTSTPEDSSSEHTHDYVETVVVEATCTAEGQKKLTCACGEETTETIPMIPHTEVVDEAIAATCTSTGLTEGKHCSVCGTKTVEQTATSKLEHDFTKQDTDGKYLASEATCTAKATYYYSCTVCGEADTNTFESGSVKAHAWMEKVDAKYLVSEATCTANAVYNKSCEYCGEKGTETFVSGSLAEHVFERQDTDGKYLATAAACGKNATYYYSCTACGEKGTATFEKADTALNHVFEKKDTDEKYFATAATCTAKATYYYSCTACGEKGTTTFESGSLAAHKFEKQDTDGKYLATAATCTAKATYYYSCTACGEKGTATFESGAVKTHDFTKEDTAETYLASQATCTAKATYYYSCTACGEKGTETFESGAVKTHDFTKEDTAETYLASQATCTAKATYYYSCTACGEKGTETFESGVLKAHDFTKKDTDNKYFATAAECGKNATYYYSCTACGEKGTETFEKENTALTHDFTKKDTDSKYLATEAACNKNETYYFSCTLCGEKGTETFEKEGTALTHDFTKKDTDSKYLATAAACEKNEAYYYSCTACGEKGTETFEKEGTALTHNYESELVEPKCTVDGYYVYTCSACGKTYADMNNMVPATGHDYEEVVTAATCTAQGYTTYTCSCGETFKGDYTNIVDHTYDVYVETIDSTCEEKGYDVYKCANCTETKKVNYQDLAEHTYTTEVTKEPTCKEAGEKTIVYTCACDKTVTEPIQKKDHNYVAGTPVAPTCTEAGYTVYTCNGCGDSYTADEVKATGHQSYTGIQTQAPTCEEEGVMTYTCDSCEDSYTEAIDALGHAYVAGTPVAPTCTEEGYTVYTCQNGDCGDTYKADFTDANGHNHELKETQEATCEDKGYKLYRCACGNEYTEEIKAKDHAINEGAWVVVTDDNGEEVLTHVSGCTYYRTYTQVCGECGDTLEKTEELTKHNYAVAITKTATCQGKGIKTYTCTEGCGDSYTEDYSVAVAEGHIWSTPQTTGGVETVTCTVDGCEETKTTIKAAEGATDASVDKSALSQTGEIQMDAATIKMDDATKSQLTDGAGNLDIHASTLGEDDKNAAINKVTDAALKEKLQSQPIFNFTVSADGSAISQFNGKMTVTVPYDLGDQDAEGIAVYFLNDNGEIDEIPATYTEIDGQGYATFETDHFSKYTVVRLTPSERCNLYGHNWKERTVNATCTADGYHLKYCIRCGANENLAVYTALGHDYEGVVTPKTCTTQGYTTYTCQRDNCYASYVGDFEEATGHNYTSADTAATCTTRGYTTYTCQNENCRNSYNSNFTPALGHAYSSVETAPTCEDKGYTTYTCTREECKYSYVSDYVAATGHDYQEDGVEEATCTAPGHTNFKCHCGKHYKGKYTPAKGHKYNKGDTHDATCQEGGYTEYKCEHCDDNYQADFTPKTKHDYDEKGVEYDATCYEKGYTRHTCKHCDAHYDDNFKDKKKHEYEATVIEPTCTEKGYTLYTCKDHGYCNDSYKSDYVPALGHDWGTDYICKREDCGAEHPALSHGQTGFYLTLRDTIANAASYFVTVEDFTIEQTEVSNDVLDETYFGDIEILKFTFAFDENGYIVGHGEFKMPVINTEYEDGEVSFTDTETYLAKVIFADGCLYAFASEIGNEDAYENYVRMSQEYMEESMGLPILQLKSMYVQLYSENARKLLTAAMGVTDKEVDAVLGAVMEFLFVKSETNEGYTFTINADQIYNVIEKLAKQSVQQIFDTFFGTGALERTFDWLTETLDKTFGELEAEIEANLVSAGYTLDDLYKFINETAVMIIGEDANGFDLRAVVDQIRDEVIGEMIVDAISGGNVSGGDSSTTPDYDSPNSSSSNRPNYGMSDSSIVDMPDYEYEEKPMVASYDNRMTVQDIKDMLSAIESMCADNSIVSLILQMTGEVSDKAEADEYIDQLLEQMKSISDYIGETEITISTNKTGAASAIELNIDLKIENGYSDYKETYKTTILVTGNGKITFNESYQMDFEDLKDEIEELLVAIDLQDGDRIGGYDRLEYVVYRNGNDMLIAYDIFSMMGNMSEPDYMEELGMEEIDGVSYYKYNVMWSQIRVQSPDGGMWGTSHYGYYFSENCGVNVDERCGDWLSYGLMGSQNYIYYNVWFTEEGELFRSEIDWEMTKNNRRYADSFWFWYNTETGEMTREEPHEYVLVDSYETDVCESESWYKYECVHCGDTCIEKNYTSHNIEWKYELLDGATNCEDGVAYIRYCTECDYEYVEEIKKGHDWNWEYVYIETECGKLAIEYCVCACGYEHYDWININGSCNFTQEGMDKYALALSEDVAYDSSYFDSSTGNDYEEDNSKQIVRTYTCADCGKKIVLTIVYGYDGCYEIGTYTITVDDEVVVDRNYTVNHHGVAIYYEEIVDGIKVVTRTCDCGEIESVCKYDQYDRQISYVNENGFGYAYEYEGCRYTYYYITPNETIERHSGMQHAQSEYPVYVLMDGSATCLDGVIEQGYCDCCGEMLYSESVYNDEHSFNVCVEKIETACGSITIVYGVCPCGEETVLGDMPYADGCEWDYAESEDGNTAVMVCAKCGVKICAGAEESVEGCVVTMSFTLNVYMDGDVAAWTLTGKYSYTNHNMDWTYVKNEDGTSVKTYGCVNCSYFEEQYTYDQYDRELRYERANGSGYYYVYNEDCTYTRYEFDRNNEWKTWSGTRHVTKERRVFIGEANCEAGVKVEYRCEVCGQTDKSYEYYHHESYWQNVYETVTDCGEITFEAYGCLCGYNGNYWLDQYGNCWFDCANEKLEDTETELNRWKETYVCSNCGFTYTVYGYTKQEACTSYEYTVYSFNVAKDGTCESTYEKVRKETNHTAVRIEEGANDEGVYLYERYCEACNTCLEHWESKNDENGRQIYYMDRLKGYGWEKVYSTTDCSYVQYTLDQLGNRGESYTGYAHAEIRTRCELMEGSTTCVDGIYVIDYCPACGMVDWQYKEYWHYRYRHIEEFDTDCGVVRFEYEACACGQSGWNWAEVNGSCNIEWADDEWFEYTEEDPRYNHWLRTYKCAITDCGFSYTEEDYYIFLKADSCLATWVKTYTLYDGKEVIYTKTFTWEQHQPQTESWQEKDANGNVITVNDCKYCDWVNKWDSFGRTVYYWDPYANWGYSYTYTGCEYYREEFDSKGVYSSDYGTNHIWYWKDIQQACTQYGTAIEYCGACGYQQPYEYVAPSHAYVWHDDLGLYVCDRCGLENEKNVDGAFIVEDLTDQYGSYTAGFFNKLGSGWQMEEGYNFYIMLNYTVAEDGTVSGENVTDMVKFDVFEYGYEKEPEGSGLITLDRDSLNAAITKVYGEGWEGYEHVSIVFQVFDKDAIGGTYSYVDHVLTFN